MMGDYVKRVFFTNAGGDGSLADYIVRLTLNGYNIEPDPYIDPLEGESRKFIINLDEELKQSVSGIANIIGRELLYRSYSLDLDEDMRDYPQIVPQRLYLDTITVYDSWIE